MDILFPAERGDLACEATVLMALGDVGQREGRYKQAADSARNCREFCRSDLMDCAA